MAALATRNASDGAAAVSILAAVRQIIEASERHLGHRPSRISLSDDLWHALFDEGDSLRRIGDPIPREMRESIHLYGVRILNEAHQ